MKWKIFFGCIFLFLGFAVGLAAALFFSGDQKDKKEISLHLKETFFSNEKHKKLL